jgi:hypothetical protein
MTDYPCPPEYLYRPGQEPSEARRLYDLEQSLVRESRRLRSKARKVRASEEARNAVKREAAALMRSARLVRARRRWWRLEEGLREKTSAPARH